MKNALILLTSLVLACGGSFGSSADGGQSGGGSGGSAGGGSGNDAGNGIDAGVTNRPLGWVGASSTNASCTLGSTGLSAKGSSQNANFTTVTRVGGPPPEYHFDQFTVGPCTATSSTDLAYVDDAGYWVSTHKSAGTITFSGVGSPRSLTFSSGTGYGQQTSNTPWWSGGEAIQISATGGDVPSFSETLTAPNVAIISSPDLRDTGTPLPVQRSSDLQVNWSGGSGTLVVQIWNQTGTPRVSIYCEFPASAHTGTVPASLLSKLPAGQGFQNVLLQNQKTIAAADWDVQLTLQSSPTSQEGCPLSRELALQ